MKETNLLLTPNGDRVGSMDRIMLLAIWAKRLDLERKEEKINPQPIIFAGIGRPTYPINDFALKFSITYLNNLLNKSQDARQLINDPERFKTDKGLDEITEMDGVIGYGDPSGDLEYRKKMAQALTTWYGEKSAINEKNILFTIGGAGALHVIFSVLNQEYPKGRIVTPFPYYSLYSGFRNANRLHPIDVMQQEGYRLTAKALEESIQKANVLAEKEGGKISAFLLCDPNNPLGTSLTEKELAEIAEVLRRYPKIWIILDEAYAEMRFNGKKVSLLTVAPDFKERMILLRSGTKALSSAGERMGVIVAFDTYLMNQFLECNIAIYGHAPRTLQGAFATAMSRLDHIELSNLKSFYEPQVKLVTEALSTISAKLPDPKYKVEGTFYVMCDLSDLFELELPEGTDRVFDKRKNRSIKTDEDIAYYLLFKDGVMITPLSYFGSDPTLGFMRITCSAGPKILNTLIKKIETRLIEARKLKYNDLVLEIEAILCDFSANDVKHLIELKRKYQIIVEKLKKDDISASELKHCNNALETLLLSTRKLFTKGTYTTEGKTNGFFFQGKNNFKENQTQQEGEVKDKPFLISKL